MTIVVAPDKFKDTLTADQVARAICRGIRSVRPHANCRMIPMADGGDGSGPILAAALRLPESRMRVAGPLGTPRDVPWWRGVRSAVLELAEIAGLRGLPREDRDPLRTTSFGVGEALASAAGQQPADGEILLCIGGSATVDGGIGCLQALGWEFLRADGARIAPPATGRDLEHVHRAVRPARAAPAVALTVLCDVTNPLLGATGAARVFAPQNGADAAAVARLEAGLTRFSAVLRAAGTPLDPHAEYGGAAGGIAAALAAAVGARLVSGFDTIAASCGLAEALSHATLCATGEGRIDAQTVSGKVVAGVARLAARYAVPVTAFCGQVAPGQLTQALERQIGLEQIIVCAPDSGAPAGEGELAAASARWLTARRFR